MKEPDVTLTDYSIAFECFIFCALLFRQYRFQPLSRWFMLFFSAIGFAAFAGGMVHGFFYVNGTCMHTIFWSISMYSIGLVAFSGWMIGISLFNLQTRISIIIKVFAGLNFTFYIGYVAFVSQEFIVTVFNYLPAVIFLFSAFIYRYFKRAKPPIAWGIIAMILTLASSSVQQAEIALHPVYFDHNALYHLIQLIALLLLFLSAKYFIENDNNLCSTDAIS